MVSLLSLLSTAAFGCPSDEPGDDDSEVANDSTSTTVTGGAPVSTSDGAPDDGMTTTTAGDSSSGRDSTGRASTGESGGRSCGEPIPVDEVSAACVAYVAYASDCSPDGGLSAECIAYFESVCQYYLEIYALNGVDCGPAFEDYYVCLSMAPCGEIGTACAREEAAIADAC